MLFVPLTLFATLTLSALLVWFVKSRDMNIRAHQLFAALLGFYALQSLLISLRWGYEHQGVAFFIALLAPVLPTCAYLAYRALSGRGTGRQLWPLGIIALNWAVLLANPNWVDPIILLTYLGFGGLLLRLCWKGPDHLSLSPINEAREIIAAMCFTGCALVISGLTDIYLIVDFVRNEGRNAGLVVSVVQTGFILLIGISSIFARSTQQPDVDADVATSPTLSDLEIIARLEQLFIDEGLHKNEDLSLRRLARRTGLSDRQVSNAINRARSLSVSQFVNNFRIKEACALLTTTDQSILEVSLSAGFATKSNFNREFLRVTSTTPSRWRREKRS